MLWEQFVEDALAELSRQTKCTKIIKNNTKYCCINTYKGYLHLL